MLNIIKRMVIAVVVSVTVGSGLLIALIRKITYHPAEVQYEPITAPDHAPMVQPGQRLKVMSYNVQYMAGKNRFFYYDGGPDTHPSASDMTEAFHAIAQIIWHENPDIILLQEVNEGAAVTAHQDQLSRLLKLLPAEYACHTQTFYWKNDFVPHRNIMGSVGQKLVVISKYKISMAIRHQLPQKPNPWLTQQFYFKRAVLEARLPVYGSQDLIILNTHFDAFTADSTISAEQVAHLQKILHHRTLDGYFWLLGGDFNLLPPHQYQHVQAETRAYFKPETEIAPLYETYQAVVPDLSTLKEADRHHWLTFLPNDPKYSEPVATLDHMFLSPNLHLEQGYVRHGDTWTASDHLPLLAEITLD